MRRFAADYLAATRRGMWEDRAALAPLELGSRERVLDVGCGSGELSRVLQQEVPGVVVGADVDRSLLAVAVEHVPVVAADAFRLPFREGAFDLVVCQALLVNLPDPHAAIREFGRVSSDLVAAIEPDNSDVVVESTVEAEERLARRAREWYLDGVDTDVALGAVPRRFEDAGLSDVRTTRYEHEQTIQPPYTGADLRSAKRKADGTRLRETRPTLLAGGLTDEGFDDLREEWRAMGRAVIDEMRAGEYRRREVVPFHVTVGRV